MEIGAEIGGRVDRNVCLGICSDGNGLLWVKIVSDVIVSCLQDLNT